ncbi:hypothetical protein GR212_32725 [Rhizobium lusitanum]|uniref:Uncharacterized protein n=1 Tax=Rhizobium lusitanum TaxID=293958 RepID=A0A6L9UIV8_9HYPH|nr:hypothetical protein [Rhizobium lusitanum]NEI74322.1 hypothetical protein [Rhizobium lusitanum]
MAQAHRCLFPSLGLWIRLIIICLSFVGVRSSLAADWCDAASSSAEKSICGNFELKKLDVEISRIYGQVRIPMKPATGSEIKPASHSDFIPAAVPI